MARLKGAKAPNVEHVIDIEAKRAEGKGAGYEHWARIHNLKNAARALALYQEYGFKSGEELDAAITTSHKDTQQAHEKLKQKEAVLNDKKEIQKNLLSYIKTKPVRDGLKAQKSEKARRAYREQHEGDFIIAEAANRYFRDRGFAKLPNKDALRTEIEALTVEANALYIEYREKSAREKELKIIRDNIEQTLHGATSHQKKHEQER